MVATFPAAFEEGSCVQATEALGLVLNASITFPLCATNCRYGALKLRKYVEGLLKGLVQLQRTSHGRIDTQKRVSDAVLGKAPGRIGMHHPGSIITSLYLPF
jgi:hypothetical protein